MRDDHSELMRRVEIKKRELELAVEKTKGERSGVPIEDALLIKKNLDYLKEVLEDGPEDLSDETIESLDGWLPQN